MCEEGKFELLNLPVEIDVCLVPLIKMLNSYGIRTQFCCCGHKKEGGYLSIVPPAGKGFSVKDGQGKITFKTAKELGIGAITFDFILPDK